MPASCMTFGRGRCTPWPITHLKGEIIVISYPSVDSQSLVIRGVGGIRRVTTQGVEGTGRYVAVTAGVVICRSAVHVSADPPIRILVVSDVSEDVTFGVEVEVPEWGGSCQ